MINDDLLCCSCKQLREVNIQEDCIVCNIQQARMSNVQKCGFYEKGDVEWRNMINYANKSQNIYNNIT